MRSPPRRATRDAGDPAGRRAPRARSAPSSPTPSTSAPPARTSSTPPRCWSRSARSDRLCRRARRRDRRRAAGLRRTATRRWSGARCFSRRCRPPSGSSRPVGWWRSSAPRSRLERVRDEALAVQMGGPVGSRAPQVAARMAATLGLAEPVMPVAHRPHARRRSWPPRSGARGRLAKIARDVTLLAQTEVGEVRERGEGRGGSSSMAHKRNPVAAVSVLACATRVPGLVATMLCGDGAGAPARGGRVAGGVGHAQRPADADRLGGCLAGGPAGQPRSGYRTDAREPALLAEAGVGERPGTRSIPIWPAPGSWSIARWLRSSGEDRSRSTTSRSARGRRRRCCSADRSGRRSRCGSRRSRSLSGRLRMIPFDHRGHGGSPMPRGAVHDRGARPRRDRADGSPRARARLLLRALDRRHGRPVARRKPPERIDKLILIATSALPGRIRAVAGARGRRCARRARSR